MGKNDFFVIESLEYQVKNFQPANKNSNSYRFLEEKDLFTSRLTDISDRVDLSFLESFESKKDRINYFKTQSKKQDLNNIVTLIQLLRSIEDIGGVEASILQKLMDNIALEYSILFECEIEEAKNAITSIIQGDK
jgi:hypothetical protein